jgi:hypothetical protein
MGCNCGKGKSSTGTSRKPPALVASAAAAGRQMFTLSLPGRLPRTFGSRLEADAENARAGGIGTVR